MFFPDKDKSYREVRRVLAPGGRCMFSVWDAHRYNPFGRIAHEVIGSFFPADPPKFYEVPFSYNLIDPIKESLIAAGPDGIEISVVRQHRSVVDFSTFARGVVFGNPVFDQIRQRGGVELTQIQEAVAMAMRQEFGGEPGRDVDSGDCVRRSKNLARLWIFQEFRKTFRNGSVVSNRCDPTDAEPEGRRIGCPFGNPRWLPGGKHCAGARNRRIGRQRSDAIGACLGCEARDPKVALVAVTHVMALVVFYNRVGA